jgi:hypothetical protein
MIQQSLPMKTSKALNPKSTCQQTKVPPTSHPPLGTSLNVILNDVPQNNNGLDLGGGGMHLAHQQSGHQIAGQGIGINIEEQLHDSLSDIFEYENEPNPIQQNPNHNTNNNNNLPDPMLANLAPHPPHNAGPVQGSSDVESYESGDHDPEGDGGDGDEDFDFED